jgi:hypothetical protein
MDEALRAAIAEVQQLAASVGSPERGDHQTAL